MLADGAELVARDDIDPRLERTRRKALAAPLQLGHRAPDRGVHRGEQQGDQGAHRDRAGHARPQVLRGGLPALLEQFACTARQVLAMNLQRMLDGKAGDREEVDRIDEVRIGMDGLAGGVADVAHGLVELADQRRLHVEHLRADRADPLDPLVQCAFGELDRFEAGSEPQPGTLVHPFGDQGPGRQTAKIGDALDEQRQRAELRCGQVKKRRVAVATQSARIADVAHPLQHPADGDRVALENVLPGGPAVGRSQRLLQVLANPIPARAHHLQHRRRRERSIQFGHPRTHGCRTHRQHGLEAAAVGLQRGVGEPAMQLGIDHQRQGIVDDLERGNFLLDRADGQAMVVENLLQIERYREAEHDRDHPELGRIIEPVQQAHERSKALAYPGHRKGQVHGLGTQAKSLLGGLEKIVR